MSDLPETRTSVEYRVISKRQTLLLMVAVALAYALLIAIGGLLFNMANGQTLFCVMYPVASASIGLAAAWAVMGTGNTLVRFIAGALFATIVSSGLLLGMYVAERIFGVFIFGFGEDKYLLPIVALCFLINLIVAQIPFWLLRAATGSHFCFEGNEVKPLISLRDMFFVVLVFALAMSASQWAATLMVASARSNVVIGRESYVTNEEGVGGFEKVTEENIEEIRDQHVQGISVIPLLSTIYFLVPIVLTLPVYWWVFRCKRIWTSVLFSLVLAAVIVALLLMLTFAMGGWSGFNSEMVTWSSVAVGMMLFLIWCPLVLLRKSGLVLRTRGHAYGAAAGAPP